MSASRQNTLLRATMVDVESPDFGRCHVQHPVHGGVVVTCRTPEHIPARNLIRLSQQGRLWFDEERWRLVLRPRERLVAERGRATA